MREADIALHGFLPLSTVNGPGQRSVVWVQGCSFACPGCFNQAARPFTREWLVTGSALLELIPDGVEGVTISGGEPFCQAEALTGFCRLAKARGLSIMLYSGFTLAALREAGNPVYTGLLNELDILVDGLYERGRPPVSRWAGSGNQQVHFLSGRYRPEDQEPAVPAAYEEIIIDETGLVTHTGF